MSNRECSLTCGACHHPLHVQGFHKCHVCKVRVHSHVVCHLFFKRNVESKVHYCELHGIRLGLSGQQGPAVAPPVRPIIATVMLSTTTPSISHNNTTASTTTTCTTDVTSQNKSKKRKRGVRERITEMAVEREETRRLIVEQRKEDRLIVNAEKKAKAVEKAKQLKLKKDTAAKAFVEEGYSNITLQPLKLRYNSVCSPTIATFHGRRSDRLTRDHVVDQLVMDDIWENLAVHTNIKMKTQYNPKCRWCRKIFENCKCKCQDCHLHVRNKTTTCQCPCWKPACRNGCFCREKELTPKGTHVPVKGLIMQLWFYTWLLIRAHGNNIERFYFEVAPHLEAEFNFTFLPIKRFNAINSALDCDIDLVQTSLRYCFHELVQATSEACVDETILAFEGDKSKCDFKIYMPRKPHKWGILVYGLVVKLELSKKPFIIDFEPHMFDKDVQAQRVSPLHALYTIIDRNVTNLCDKLHLAVDSAFGTTEMFNLLTSKATYVTASITQAKFGQDASGKDRLSVLSHQLPTDHYRLFYSPRTQKTISICSDKGAKDEESIVLTMSNAYEPVTSHMNELQSSRPVISYDDALAISKLPNTAMMLWCHDVGVEYIPGQPFENVKHITQFDITKYISDLNAGTAEQETTASLNQHTVEELKALARGLGLAVKGNKSAIVHRLVKVMQQSEATSTALADLTSHAQKGKPKVNVKSSNPFAYYLNVFNAQDNFDTNLYAIPWAKSMTWRHCYTSSLLWMAIVNAYALFVEAKSVPLKIYNETVEHFVKQLAISKLQQLQ